MGTRDTMVTRVLWVQGYYGYKGAMVTRVLWLHGHYIYGYKGHSLIVSVIGRHPCDSQLSKCPLV